MDVAAEVVTRARQHGSLNPQQKNYLLSHLAKLPAQDVVPALLSIFSRAKNPESEEAIQEQHLAGYLLWNGQHDCPVPLRDALLMLLNGWNVSVEEVPLYLTREYGQAAVRDCIASLLEQHSSEQHKHVLRTLDYWVRNYEPIQPDP